MIPLLLSLCLLQSLHFGPKLNLDVDLAHFRGENATFQMKKYVATTVGVWLSPRIFQKRKTRFIVQHESNNGEKSPAKIVAYIRQT